MSDPIAIFVRSGAAFTVVSEARARRALVGRFAVAAHVRHATLDLLAGAWRRHGALDRGPPAREPGGLDPRRRRARRTPSRPAAALHARRRARSRRPPARARRSPGCVCSRRWRTSHRRSRRLPRRTVCSIIRAGSFAERRHRAPHDVEHGDCIALGTRDPALVDFVAKRR